ncbi:hypothetical protein [Parasitella parasitica]|uniref:Inositol polyphosphate-related phosphatase domain-containing protein n=1 Tax=Parasitella parasitica TaxID=35722 RepID=A0A0B7N3Q6_9FUNG|nr:hypothetical protein [Parasitella parasitica]
MSDIEQDWTCPFKQSSSAPIASASALSATIDDALLVIPDVSRSVKLNLPRSNSLDKLYHYSSKRNDTLKSLFPPSGYDDSDSDDDDDQRVQLLRSFTVGSKHITHHREIYKCSGSPAHSTGAHPADTSHASKTAPVFGHEIRIANEYGAIHAIATKGATIVVGTSHYNIQSYNIKRASDALFTSPALPCQQDSTDTTTTIRSICLSLPTECPDLVWAGTENGSILAVNAQGEIIAKRAPLRHQRITTILLAHQSAELWTIDDAGNLDIWPASTVSLLSEAVPCLSVLVAKNTKTAIWSPTKPNVLWMSAGRSIDRFDRSLLTAVPVVEMPAELGEIAQLFTVPCHPHQIFAAHLQDGQISAWDESTGEKTLCVTLSTDKLTAVLPVGQHWLWAGFCNGMLAIYDTRCGPWVVVKIWKAHKNAVEKLAVDALSVSQTMPVVSVDSAGHIAIWDGLLTDYWLEEQMAAHVSDYCDFGELKTMVCSWNMDAVKPEALTEADVDKIHEWLHGMNDPDIIMVGIQEIVDLNSKTLTAKSLLSLNRKIETIEDADELLTHRYMLWHDYLVTVVDANFGKNSYKILKTDQMVGLFSCIFVKTGLESRIRQCDSNVVKTGFRLMNKSLHGNKGGIATRLIIDDTSLCFVNCHLAAGQSNVLTRNVDVEGILHSARFPACSTTAEGATADAAFKSDADGTGILDHETCFLSGDLNYRIAMKRDQVLALLAEGSSNSKFEVWETLQQEDQLKKQLAFNPIFRMFGFKEPPLLFDPTYKYDRASDAYDSSEKKRTPAWCDRILHRGPASLSNLYYRRHELKASDHRPISAGFLVHVKTVDPQRLEQVKARLELEWQQLLLSHVQHNKLLLVTCYDLCDEKEALHRLENADWCVEQVVRDLYRDKGQYLF